MGTAAFRCWLQFCGASYVSSIIRYQSLFFSSFFLFFSYGSDFSPSVVYMYSIVLCGTVRYFILYGKNGFSFPFHQPSQPNQTNRMEILFSTPPHFGKVYGGLILYIADQTRNREVNLRYMMMMYSTRVRRKE